MVEHSLLFQKMIKSGLSLIFIRLQILIYALKSAQVRWNGDVTEFFSLTNGVKQEGVLSAIQGLKSMGNPGSVILGGQAFGRKEGAFPCGTKKKKLCFYTQIEVYKQIIKLG